MPVTDRQEGSYELFETTSGSWILVLDDTRWAAWVQGQAGEILVGTDEDHEKARTISEGEYMFLDFDEDPKFKDMPHLFLAGDDEDRELILPNGWPDEYDKQKKVIETGQPISTGELREYLASGPPRGEGEERMGRPGGGSMANVTYHLKGFDFPGKSDALVDYARQQDAPDEVLEKLEALPPRKYENMADVTDEIGERTEDFPIENYDKLSAQEAADRVHELSGKELERVEEYERENKNRTTILKAIDAVKTPKVPDDYDRLKADDIEEIVSDASSDELEALEGFEREHSNRKSVLQAIDQQRRGRR